MVIGAVTGAALSSVTVAGQDNETYSAEINIEDGKEPLYVVASSTSPMIWRLTGHVERVAYFSGSAFGGVGAIGLPKEKMELNQKADCMSMLNSLSAPVKAKIAFITRALGKPADGIYVHSAMSSVNLPSGAVPPTSWDPNSEPPASNREFSLGDLKATDDETSASFRHLDPGGLFTIDPSTVISSGTAGRYQILPMEAGLLQLVQNGSIRYLGHSTYLIRAPFAQFPAGLYGAHAVHFILPDGIPRPGGNPRQSLVTTAAAAETGAGSSNQ